LALRPELVFIASNHASHTDYAIKCLDKGISVHIEKPISTTKSQAVALHEVMRRTEAKVYTGYNRPGSKLFQTLRQRSCQYNDKATINWFVEGHEIEEGHWYFSPDEGGRVLGNMTHWLDLSIELVGVKSSLPILVTSPSQDWLGSNFLVNLEFGDGSIATISFSTNGHAFEGVRERLNYQRGDLTAYLEDFQFLEIDDGNEKSKIKLRRRDHGHRANVINSLKLLDGEARDRVLLTSLLALAVNKAILSNESILVTESLELASAKSAV
jgi:predicted dehydrogenase